MLSIDWPERDDETPVYWPLIDPMPPVDAPDEPEVGAVILQPTRTRHIRRRIMNLGLVAPRWLDDNLDDLRAVAGTVSATGTSVTHFDLRSDNVCLSPDRVHVIDWSHACLGDPTIDLGLFLPGVEAAGGLPPETLLPQCPGVAAWVAGFYAWHASKAEVPAAQTVRSMQRRHLRFALQWVGRALGLDSPETPGLG